MTTDNNGTLWVATNGAGIAKLVNGEFVYYNTSNSNLTGNYTYSIVRDSTGHLWCSAITVPNYSGVITSGANGLFRIENDIFVAKPISGRNTSQIRSITCDLKGKVWVALSDDRGIAAYDNQTSTWDVKTITSFSDSRRAYYISVDKKNRKWISTQFSGYTQYNDTAFTTMPLVNASERFFTNPTVDDTVWNASFMGSFNRYNPNRNQYPDKTAASLGITDVTSLSVVAFDRYGGKWYSTNNGVVYQGCDTTIQFDLGTNSTTNIYIDKQNTKWIAPYSVGLSNLVKLIDVKADFTFNTITCAGTAVAFSNVSSELCRMPLTYKWNFGDGTATTTQTSPSHIFSQAGTYDIQLIATNPRGIADTLFQSITVTSCNNIVPSFAIPDTVCMRTPITFQNTTTGSHIASYLWKVPHWPTNSASFTTLDTLTSTEPNPTFSININNQNSPYVNVPVTLIVTDSSGNKFKLTQNVVVAAPVQVRLVGVKFTPPISMQVVPFSDTTVCANSGLNIGATYVPFNSIFYTAITSIRLYRNDTLIHAGLITESLEPYLKKSGTYYAVTSNTLTPCADTSQKITIKYNPVPKLNILGDTVVCAGSTAELYNMWQDSTSYQWYKNGILLPAATDTTLSITQAGTYSIKAVNQCGCVDSVKQVVTADSVSNFALSVTSLSPCLNDSTKLAAPTGFASYLWSNGSTNSSITVTDTSTYSLTVTNVNGCTRQVSGKALFQPMPTVTVVNTGNSHLCAGDSTTLIASGGFGQFVWNNGATTQFIKVKTAGDYFYKVKINNCWAYSDTVHITGSLLPTIYLNFAGDTILCNGQSVTIAPRDTLQGGEYLWNRGDTTIAITVNQTGIYYVNYRDTLGCSARSNTVGVLTNGVAVVDILLIGKNVLCEGDTVSLLANQSGQYQWNTGQMTQLLQTAQAGYYFVKVLLSNGCTIDSDTVFIKEATPPKITLVADSVFCSITGAVLEAQPQWPVLYYEWFDKDGQLLAQSVKPTFKVEKTGVYSVKAWDGCRWAASDPVRIEAMDCALSVPNVITPNGDGDNDQFKIKELDLYAPLHLRVHNRWGKLMYENKDYRNDWTGDDLPAGTYFIHINSPRLVTYKGWLEILR
ncbi:T9SS type B sorting domain-containing protein [Flexibacter flexilis]|nr:gliding motility-associated C-terminal domain-containing protein [Flexibacter flexilis]